MILVDANILIYASLDAFDQHGRAAEWLDAQLNGTTRVGLPWVALVAFLRIVTNPRSFRRPVPMRAACEQLSQWLACETAWIPQPTEHHAETLVALLELPGIYGNLVTDAHLAALAIEHGLILCSTDGDFARFSKLRWINPLAD